MGDERGQNSIFILIKLYRIFSANVQSIGEMISVAFVRFSNAVGSKYFRNHVKSAH